MPLWDQLRGLELNIEDVTTERKSVEVSTQFTRVTTTVVLGGEGEHGRGEDVTYTPEDHDWFPDLEARGRTTLGELSAELDGLQLFETEPAMPAWADYRRWAFESAALDLALRQNDLSLGAAVKRDYHPVRFVVSTRGDAFGWVEHIPGVELKLDPENDWDRPFMERLAATGRVRVLDFKAYYKGTAVDVVPDPVLYATALELFPDAVLEDASLDGECGAVLRGQEGRMSFDAPIHSVADVQRVADRSRLDEHQAFAFRHDRAATGVHRVLRGRRDPDVRRRPVRARCRTTPYPGARVTLLSRRAERRGAARVQRRRPAPGAAAEPSRSTGGRRLLGSPGCRLS